MAATDPLCLLLLPEPLERSAFAERARDLLRAPSVVAIEPARVRTRGADSVLGEALAVMQARRLTKRLPGPPRVVVVLESEQYLLARALIARHRDCELWYGGGGGDLGRLARERAALLFDAQGDPATAAFQRNRQLWDRLEELGLARR